MLIENWTTIVVQFMPILDHYSGPLRLVKKYLQKVLAQRQALIVAYKENRTICRPCKRGIKWKALFRFVIRSMYNFRNHKLFPA